MRKNAAVLIGAALTIGALGACSKPASDAATTEAASTTAGAMQAGGAVSPPSSPQNDAINADANKGEVAQTPGSNSFTQDQAKGHVENAGYTDVTELTKTPDGMWTGSAMKDGKTVKVSVDFKGAVTAN